MSEHTPQKQSGRVSERDREIMRKQGRAQAEANRGMRPPGTLKAALDAYSRPKLPLIPEEACHPFHAKAATDSTAKLPPWQVA